MELSAVTYYNHDRFFNSFYLISSTLRKLLAQEIFKNDGTRVIYASSEYAFRQRLNQLNSNSTPDHNSLKLPFGCIYHNTPWEIDSVRAKGTSMLRNTVTSRSGDSISCRFFNMKTTFDGMLFFGRDDDARIAYETLIWLQHPTSKLLKVEGFTYKGVTISLPMTISISNVTYSAGYKEKQWLAETRLIPISFTIEVASNVLDQYRQGAKSMLFDTYIDDELAEVRLTETVILDFLSYFGANDYVDQEGILLEVISDIAPDPALNGTFSFSPEIDPDTHEPIYEDTSVRLTWTFGNPVPPGPDNREEILALYETDVRIVCSNGTSYYAPMANNEYVVQGLSPDSSYEFSIFFIAKSGAVTKYTTVGSTTEAEVAPNLKGMVGLTW